MKKLAMVTAIAAVMSTSAMASSPIGEITDSLGNYLNDRSNSMEFTVEVPSVCGVKITDADGVIATNGNPSSDHAKFVALSNVSNTGTINPWINVTLQASSPDGLVANYGNDIKYTVQRIDNTTPVAGVGIGELASGKTVSLKNNTETTVAMYTDLFDYQIATNSLATDEKSVFVTAKVNCFDTPQ